MCMHTHTHLQAHTHNNDLYNNAFIKHACITGDVFFLFLFNRISNVYIAIVVTIGAIISSCLLLCYIYTVNFVTVVKMILLKNLWIKIAF